MKWIRLFHLLGLTNLSDAQVSQYEKQQQEVSQKRQVLSEVQNIPDKAYRALQVHTLAKSPPKPLVPQYARADACTLSCEVMGHAGQLSYSYWPLSGDLTPLLNRAREDAWFHWFWYQGDVDEHYGESTTQVINDWWREAEGTSKRLRRELADWWREAEETSKRLRRPVEARTVAP